MSDDGLFGAEDDFGDEDESGGEYDQAGDDGAEGEYDQAGDDSAEGEDELGASPRRRRGRGRRPRKMLSQKGGAAFEALTRVYGPNPFRRASRPVELQFPATTVAAGGVATVTVTCGRPMAKLNAIRLIASAVGLVITSAVVGDRNVNSGSGNLDTTTYSNQNDQLNFTHCPTVTPSTPLVVGLSNPTAAAITVSGILRGWGTVLPGGS